MLNLALGMPADANFRFRISIAGVGGRTGGSFPASNVSEASSSIDPMEFRQAGKLSPSMSRLTPTLSSVRIELAITATSELLSWWRDTTDSSKPLSKRTVEIALLDDEGRSLKAWRLTNSWPFRTGLCRIGRDSASSALREFYELVFEGIESNGGQRPTKDSSPTPTSTRPETDPSLKSPEREADIKAKELRKLGAKRAKTATPAAKEAWKEALTDPKKDLSVKEVRHEYNKEVTNIGRVTDEMAALGFKKSEIAKEATLLRRQLGVKYKNATPRDVRLKTYKRNIEKYGDPLGPTLKMQRAQGKTWKVIIDKASKPNEQINKAFGVGA